MPRFALAVSEAPDVGAAAGEILADILEVVGSRPDLAVVFVPTARAGQLHDLMTAVRRLAAPGMTLGVTTSTVVAGSREYEGRPTVAVWAAHLDGVHPVRLRPERTDGGVRLSGLDPRLLAEGHSLVLLADPHTTPVAPVLDHLADRHDHLTVVGGLAVPAGEGRPVVAVDDEVSDSGAVGFVLAGSDPMHAVVSQGARPIGEPLTVTGAEGQLVTSLGGQPARDRLIEAVTALPEVDRQTASVGLLAGLAATETADEHVTGDFLVRAVRGVTPEGVVVGDRVDVGTTLQFQLRDAASADAELRDRLAGLHATGALLFTCNGRGSHLFGVPDHDAAAATEALAPADHKGPTLAGMACAGEIGPVGGRPHLHGFTACLALFGSGRRDPDDR